LEQSNQKIIKGKEQAYIAQEKMRKEIQSLKVEIIEKETTLQSIESQVSHSKEINEDQSKSESEKEKAVTAHKQKDELSKETEHFKIKISGKDEVIQELFDFSNNMEATKTEKEAHIIGIVNENRQIVYLRKQLKQSYDEMASLRGNCIQLRNSNQEKVVQISELKDTIEENTRQLQERKSVTAKNYNLLQKKLKHAHNQLKTCKQEIEFEKNKADIEMTKLHSEIKCCNLKIKEQEAELLRLGVDFTNQVELKEREESELNDLYEKETELHKSVRIKETEYEVSEG
jgi:chromosome segregation ATPase